MKKINFINTSDKLILEYYTEYDFIRKKIDSNDKIRVKKIFNFSREDILSTDKSEHEEDATYQFLLGKCEDGYYRIDKRIFDSKFDIFIPADINYEISFFATGYMRQTSIFKRISNISSDDSEKLYIGGSHEEAMPLDVYYNLLKEFPTTRELQLISEAMVESSVREYIPTVDAALRIRNYEKRKYENRVNKLSLNSDALIKNNRLETYKIAYQKIQELLESGEQQSELAWHEVVFPVLPLLYPQYVSVISEVRIFDNNNKIRKVDFLLIDLFGNVDVIEIKKGFNKEKILRKRKYRDNYVPAAELTGAIVQVKKYIFALSRNEEINSKKILKDHRNRIPQNITELKATSPSGIIIYGNAEFSPEEQLDFDLMRRQYSGIIDIFTFNNLRDRLNKIIESLEET